MRNSVLDYTVRRTFAINLEKCGLGVRKVTGWGRLGFPLVNLITVCVYNMRQFVYTYVER